MYRLNKEAKRFRDLKREYYDNDYTLTKNVFDAIIELTEDEYNSVSFDEEMGYVGSYYYGVLNSLDELEDSLMDSQTEISDIEYKLDNIDEYEEEDEEELRERLEDEENDREKLIKFIDELTSFERINPFTLFKEQIDRLYSLKNEVLDSLIGKDEKGKSDGIHKFENGDIRYLYELGDYSFHGRDLVDEISSEEYDEAEEIEEISSKNILAIDMSIEEAIDNLENFLKSGVRFRMSTDTPDIELQRIKDKAIADGTFMKAPNGKPTNLNERQWLQVRTPQFKEWFGDWEKVARIEKLRKAKIVAISGNEIEPSDDLRQYKKNALEYGKKLQGHYVNKDTGRSVHLQRGRKNGGVNEVLQHDYKNVEHLQSISAIPQIIEEGIYIDSEANKDIAKHPNVSEYQHYVCGLKISDEDYTVHSIVAVDNNGERYYDHNLTRIEKTKLLDYIDSQAAKRKGFGTMPSELPLTTNSEYKAKNLASLLQVGAVSKVVDENGEPLVVYHGTDSAGFTEFRDDENGIYFSTIDRASWYVKSGDYPKIARQFGDDTDDYGGMYACFLNVRNPKRKNANGKYAINYNQISRSSKQDGVIVENINDPTYDDDSDFEATNYIVFSPSQIKSATDNVGTFDSNNADIRFRRDETTIRGYVEGNNEDGFRREENDMLLSRTHEDRMRENPLAYDALFDRAGVEGVALLVGENLGINVRVASRNSVKKSRRKEKGFFDVAKSEVVVFFENLRSERSLTDFVLQTVVLNKGINSVLGESQYSTVKQHIYSSLLDTSKYMLLESFPEATEEELAEECLVRISEHFLDSETIKGIAKEVRSILYAKGLNTSLRDGEKETIETFENEMKKLEQDGKALSLNPQQERPNLPFRSDKMAEKEHVVRVLFNGVERRVYMN